MKAIPASLHADKCQIFTDVEGVYTADPRKIPSAVKLDEITYDEPLISIFSIFTFSLTIVPGTGLSDERTSSSTEYFLAISTERLLSTCACLLQRAQRFPV